MCPGRILRCMSWCTGDDWKKKASARRTTAHLAYEVKLMDGAPYKHYTFLLHFGKAATGEGGGMEHANSTAISVRSDEEFPECGGA